MANEAGKSGAGRLKTAARERTPVRPPAGYSGTPLWKKLGVRDGQSTWRLNMPASIADEIAESGVAPSLVQTPRTGLEMAHLFVTRRAELAMSLERLRNLIAPDGIVWVSWPKKSPPKGVAPIPSDITEDAVRGEALPLGFVDIKVCAVDAVWSGLKLVIRKSERS